MADCHLRESRIPSSLINTYVQYKKDTGAVIAWLTSHGSEKYRRLTVISLQDLLSLAEIVKAKAVAMPGTIDFQFREAIAARTSLSKWYRRAHDHFENEDQNTCNHEHFTTCLSNIYKDLCNCCAKPKDKCTRKHKRNKSDDKCRGTINRFATLDIGQEEQVKKSHPSSEQLEAKTKDNKPGGQNTPVLRLLDDTLSEAFELRQGIQDMHDLLTTTQHIWEKAAKQETSVIVATFITHLAFAEFEEIGDRLQTSCDVQNPGMLWSKYMRMEQDLGPHIDEMSEPQSSPKAMIEVLKECWSAIDQTNLDFPKALSEKGCSHLTPQEGPEAESNDKECAATILKNIGYHIHHGSLHNNIIRRGSPVNDEVWVFFISGVNNSLRCCFGLTLLLQSYKSSLSASPAPFIHAAGRLQALKFAQQGITSINAALDASTFGCRCPHTIAGHLHRLLDDLEDFMKKKVFDLYFQSPWVSGSHILEMLGDLFNAGLRLFSYQNHASAILHAYNVLRQFNFLSAIPLLERLIESGLGEVIFPGGRPNRNFKACYYRSLGGRLCFDSRRQKAQHQSGCHSMRVPTHTEMVTHGIREPKCDGDTDHRFDIEKISLLHYIKSRQYYPTKANLDRVKKNNGVKQKNQMVPKLLQSVSKGSCSHVLHPKDDTLCPHRRLQFFGKAIHTELSGPFPVGKVNFFSLYLACLRMVSTISDRYHATIDRDKPKGQKCDCFTHTLMSAADRCREDENLPFGYKELVEICREVIEEVMLEKSLKDFLWKDL